ncbi:MAG TPA: hypothetical protein VIP29_06965 [Nitrososphaeraceae archaeon]
MDSQRMITSLKKLLRNLIVPNVGNGWNMITAHVLSVDIANDANF